MLKRMKKRIKEAISALNVEDKKKHDECITQGLKDEICLKCDRLFLAHIHFVACENKPCPMSNGKTFWDMWIEALEAKENNETITQQTRDIIEENEI